MRIEGAVAVITGAGSGIGAELGRRFVAEGADYVLLTDRDSAAVAELAGQLGERAGWQRLDVTDPAALAGCVERVERERGRIDLFCSNAGLATGAGLDADPEQWQLAWQVHVLAHVHAARAVLPGMVARGGGYLLHTASAAGLLSSPGDAPYTVTKHATVALAEWLAYQYADRNIRVSVLCPMGVATPLLQDGLAAGQPAAQAVTASGEVIGVEQVADAVVAGLAAESFLILPHPQVGKFWAGKAADVDRWLAGMAQLAQQSGTTG